MIVFFDLADEEAELLLACRFAALGSWKENVSIVTLNSAVPPLLELSSEEQLVISNMHIKDNAKDNFFMCKILRLSLVNILRPFR